MTRESVAILGAGAWGTALAVHLGAQHAHFGVRLWARDALQAQDIAAARENRRYLPGISLPAAVQVTAHLADALAGVTLIIVATPIRELEPLVGSLLPRAPVAPLLWLGKGFLEIAPAPGYALAHSVIAPRWPAAVGVISGPSFAEEVARGLPTAVTIAASAKETALLAARTLRGPALRAYVSDDLVGVEVGGAVKNVLAIAAGASDGLGFGDNARAALITRGLAETGRLSLALGGKRETLMGLAGLGDLVLTCTGDLSRNRQVGLALARERKLDDILAELGHVAEGVFAANAVRALASAKAIDMPICDAVYRVLREGLSPRRAVQQLLEREPGSEGA